MNTENTTPNETQKETQPKTPTETDARDIPTVTPDNDNGEPGEEESSNKGKGPKGENL